MTSPVRWRRQSAPIWDANPPPPRVKKYERLTVAGTAPTEVLILSDQLEETWTHYADRRTVFCTGPTGGCWLDHALVGQPRYGAWLAVQDPKVAVCYLLRLTSVAVASDNRVRLERGRLRGRRLHVWRLHASAQSEMHCKIFDLDDVVRRLLPAPDVRYCVERMVSAEDRPLGPGKGKWTPMKDAAAAAAGRHPQLK